MFKYEHWTDVVLIALGIVLSFLSLRWMLRGMKWVQDDIDKKEFAALIFIAILIWMRWTDGNRDHEWRYFSDLDYMTTYAFIAVGLGLKEIIDAIYAFRGTKRNADKE